MNILIPILAVIIFLVAFMLMRTVKLQNHPTPTDTFALKAVDEAVVAKHLSEIVQIRSVSQIDPKPEDLRPFLKIHEWITKTYPKVSSVLTREVINSYSLLYK